MQRMSRAFLQVLGPLVSGVLLAAVGCSQPTPTPAPSKPTVTLPTPLPTATPRAAATPGVQPSATTPLVRLVVGDAAVQYWSDPNEINGLVFDGAHVWAATSGGAARWGVDGGYQLYGPDEGLASLALRGVALDADGHVWVGYADRATWSEYDGQRWHTYADRQEAVEARYVAMLGARTLDPRLWARSASSGWLWLPDGKGRLQAYDGKRWRTYTEYNGITRQTWMVAVSPNGRVWALGEGLSTAEEGDVWWSDHTFFSDIAHWSQVTDLAASDQGDVWLAFSGQRGDIGGLCHLHLEGETVRWRGYVRSVNPALLQQIHTLEIEDDGTIWLGGEGGIVVYRPGSPWRSLGLDDLSVRSVVRAGETLWLGTTRGLWRYRTDRGELTGPWQVPSPLVGHDVLALGQAQDGRLLIGMPSGLSIVEPDGASHLVLDEPVTGLARAPDGAVWVGTEQGVWEVDANGPTRRLDREALSLAFGADGVLYGCDAEGLLWKAPAASSPEAALSAAPLKDLRALIGAVPRSLAVDSQGTVWFSSENGLGGLKADGTFEQYTDDNGLLSRDVRDVAVGSEDTLWLATDYGLARRLANGRFTRFTTESTEGGLLSHDLWDVLVDADDVLWMATSGGISYRTPEVDWANLAVGEARCVLPTERGIWVGTPNGLYLVQREAMTVLP